MLTSKLIHGSAQPLLPMDHQSLHTYITNIGELQVASEDSKQGEMLLISKHSRVHEYLDDQLRNMVRRDLSTTKSERFPEMETDFDREITNTL